MAKLVVGSCLCGAVKVSMTSIERHLGACHCNMCRKWGGGPLLGVECDGDISFSGEENIGVYPSSQWAERGFCRNCGSHLFYRLKEKRHYFIPMGIVDNEPENLEFDTEVFIEEKPDYYAFANATTKMTGAELFEQFSSPPS